MFWCYANGQQLPAAAAPPLLPPSALTKRVGREDADDQQLLEVIHTGQPSRGEDDDQAWTKRAFGGIRLGMTLGTEAPRRPVP